MRRLLPARLALLPLALHAYLPSFSQAGYFPAKDSPRAVSSLNPGWDFTRGDGYKARVNLPHTLNIVGFEASGGSNPPPTKSASTGPKRARASSSTSRDARAWTLHRSARCASLPCPSLASLLFSREPPLRGAHGQTEQD